MSQFFHYKQVLFCRKVLSFVLVISFSLLTIVQPVGSQGLPIVQETGFPPVYAPAVLRGMTVHPENPLSFDFIVDRGQDMIKDDLLKEESLKLIKYFLASMTIPDKDAWVNLSPTEKDRIIPDALGQTEMGRQMLEQDYLLKHLAASLTNPDTVLGKKYWDEVHRLETLEARRSTLEKQDARRWTLEKQDARRSTLEKQDARRWTLDVGESKIQSTTTVQPPATNVQLLPTNDRALNPSPQPPDTAFNKVWIIPDGATVVEKDGFAYITESKLTVMLGEDYIAQSLSSPKASPVLSSPKVFIGDPQTGYGFPLKARGNDRSDEIAASTAQRTVDAGRSTLEKQDARRWTLDVGESKIESTTTVQPLATNEHFLNPNPQPLTPNISTRVFRAMILPKLIEEVNTSKDFAATRQVYQSVILAAWYKRTLKDSLLGRIYADKNKVAGIETEVKDIKQKVYEQYLSAFKKGAYNIIKEENGPDGEMIPRKYFSGGHIMSVDNLKVVSSSSAVRDVAQRIRSIPQDQLALVSASTVETGTGEEQVVVGSSGVGQGQGDQIFLSGWEQGHVPQIFQPDLRAAVYAATHIEIEDFSRQHLDGDQTPYILDFNHTPTSRRKLAQVTQALMNGNKDKIIEAIFSAFMRRTNIQFSDEEQNAIRRTIGLLAEQIKDYNTPQEVQIANAVTIKYYRVPANTRAEIPFVTQIIEELIAQKFAGDALPLLGQEVVVERIVTGGFENQVDLITFQDGRQYILKVTVKDEDEHKLDPYLKNQKEILERLNTDNNDPRIARLVLYGAQPQYDYLVENYLPGESLFDAVEFQGVFSLESVLEFAVNLAKAVGFVHSRGVIVRDLIPTNINVDNDGKVYLYDFDVSSTDDYDWDKDAYGISNTVIRPRIDYSNEGNQIEAKESDAQLDIVYIGQAIYFAATGNILPKKAEDISVEKIGNQELLNIIQRTLAPRDNGRYKNVDELLADLLALQEKPNISSSSSVLPLGENQEVDYSEYISNKKQAALANGLTQEVIDQHRFLTLAESRNVRDYFVKRKEGTDNDRVMSGVIDMLNTPGRKIVLDVGPGEHALFVHALAGNLEFSVIGVGVDEMGMRVMNNAFLLNGDINDVLQVFPDRVFDLISMFNPETIWDSDKTSRGPDEIFFSLIESGIVQSKVKVNGRIAIKPFWNATAVGIQRLQVRGYPFREVGESEFKGATLKDVEIVEEYENLSGYNDNRYDNFFVLDIVAPTQDRQSVDKSSASPLGGIDFDSSKLNLQIKRDGHGVPLPLLQQDLKNINIEGLFPVIINIMPVNAQTLPILGQGNDEADERPVQRVKSLGDTALLKNGAFF